MTEEKAIEPQPNGAEDRGNSESPNVAAEDLEFRVDDRRHWQQPQKLKPLAVRRCRSFATFVTIRRSPMR